MASLAEKCRRMATAAARNARFANDPTVRQISKDTALRWQEMAKNVEKMEKTAVRNGPKHRPSLPAAER